MAKSSAAVLALLLTTSAAATTQPECKTFKEIYGNGKGIAEKMWGSSFKYETNETNAYTMWFFDRQNPNDALSKAFGHIDDDHETCQLQYFHKETPGPEPDAFTECHPWKESACCAHATVMSAQTINQAYGAEWHWDRCGKLSSECERFFVQEACFYECDPNAGYYRKFSVDVYDPKCDEDVEMYNQTYATEKGCDHNTWQMHEMPIKASYFDAWFAACKNDKFCGDGDYYSCAAVYEEVDVAAALKAEEEKFLVQAAEVEKLKAEVEANTEDEGLSSGIIALLVVLGILVVLMCLFTFILVTRERGGKPMFGHLDESSSSGAGGNVIGSTC